MLGDFNDTTFEHRGITSRFFRRDREYFVETDGPGGQLKTYKINGVAGIAPLQQYLVEIGSGRQQALDVAWDVAGKRWYHLYPGQQLTAGDGLHWTGPYKNWNTRCAECHATGYVKGYEPAKRRYQSRQAEIGVGCEACHGPGSVHLDWAKANSVPADYGLTKAGFTVDLSATSPETEIQQCAGCHARRGPLGAESPLPGTPFHDAYRLALLRPGLYHADGQIDDEVYVYGSFVQSKMYEKGVRCSNCHEPHGSVLKAEGNAICTQCHNVTGNPDFPTLKSVDYDSPDHHHHEAGSDGAQCVSCHMPAKNYMVIDGRRDHSFKVPRPDLSMKLGTPNACTGCHAGETAAWAQQKIRQWYPEGRSGKPHHAEAFASARDGQVDPATLKRLIDIARDASQPAIVRATALELARPAIDAGVLGRIAELLDDKSALVRTAALTLFRNAPAQVRFRFLVLLTEDARKSVRIAAARELINISPARFPEAERAKVTAAIREFQASLIANTDYPEIQMNLAGLALATRNLRAAESALNEALRLDQQLSDAWHMLARLQLASRQPKSAEQTLKNAIKAVPQAGPLHQLLGSVLVQLGKNNEAVASLRRAAGMMSTDANVRINLATTLTRLKRHAEATLEIEAARKLAPNSPDVLALLAINYLQTDRFGDARELVRQLVERHPGFRLPSELEALSRLPQ